MSADNGIYILQTKDGFRVTHAQAIENLNWWQGEDGKWGERAELNPKVVYDYFHDSKVFSTREEALVEADRKYQAIMEDDFCPIVEYGIRFIPGMEDKDFPTEGTYLCLECKSTGFEPSVTGKGCTFCDGTEGGNPPDDQD